jgi:effector-binding domain-containing protein
MAYSVEFKELAPRPAAVVRFQAHVSEMGDHLGKAFGAAMQYIQATGSGSAGPPFAYFEQLGTERFDVRAGFPVQSPVSAEGDVEPFELPGGLTATTLHVGSYSKLSEAYAAIEEAAKDAGYTIDTGGPSWEEYLSEQNVSPEQTQTVVYMPVRRKETGFS